MVLLLNFNHISAKMIEINLREILMDNQERKLSSEELEQLLKEVETEPEVKVLPDVEKPKKKKKKPKVRIDMVIAAIVALVLVACLVFMIVHFATKSSTNAQKAQAENALQDEKYPEISEVVKHYLEAYLIKDPVKRRAEIAKYVDNMGAIDEGEIKYNDYITSYKDIECYTKKGLNPNSYVLFAYYQMKLKNISTPVPAITTLYIIRDAKNNKIYIHNGIKTNSEIKDHINKVKQDEDVKALFADVQKEFNEAIESDKYLKDFFNKLNATKKK